MLKRLLRSKRSPLSGYSFAVRILLTFGSTGEYVYNLLTGPTSSDIPETPFEGSREGSLVWVQVASSYS